MTYRYLLLGLLVACVNEPGATVCPTGIVCPDGSTCAAAQPVCIVNPCGNGRLDTGESCDDGNILSGDGCSPTCGNESCGNGLVEPGERCDDNNTANGDGCSADCLSLEQCGNNIIDVKNGGTDAEKCDDGNTAAGDGCRADCKEREFCNNGFLDPGEVCDDGQPTGGPCSPDCMSGLGCGNGFLDPGEQCDDGNTVDADDCRFPSCKIAVCGDGVENNAVGAVLGEECDGGTTGTPVETATCNIDCTDVECGDGKVNQTAGEQCDTGTAGVDSTTCDMGAAPHGCTIRVCGDNYVNSNEACDPGAPGADVVGCDSDCTMPACGDGHVNDAFTPTGGSVPEGCDDGVTPPVSGDGCSEFCQIETCGNGVTESVNGELCDDGNQDDLDGCRNNCQMPRCGDGIHSSNPNGTPPGGIEVCDTNGDSATCDFDCTAPMCGDGHVNQMFNAGSGVEQCEDGNSTNGDGCSSSCRLEPFALAIAKAGNGAGTVTSGETPAGINCGSDCSQIYLAGTVVTLTATPANNATFTGWSGLAPSAGNTCVGTTSPCTVTMSQSRNLTATFEANTLTIAKLGTGSGTVTGPTGNPCAGGINCGIDCAETYNVGTMVMLMAMPTSDSIFGGWGGAAASCGMTASCMVTMNQASSATATFTLNTFTLTLTKAGTGTGNVASSPMGVECAAGCTMDTGNFTANTLVTLVPTPSADSDFASWAGACSGSGNCAVTMDMSKSVTATFNLKPVVLTVTTTSGGSVSSAPAGITCPSDCSNSYPNGQVVTLTATPTPNAGKAFAGWGGACSGTQNTCMVTMDAAKSVSATFVDNRLTVEREGAGSGTVSGPVGDNNGISCGGNCLEDYEQGTMVTLTAAAGNGSIFTGWSEPASGGTCGTNLTCQVTMNAPRTVTATFADADTLTVDFSGLGSGTVTGTGFNCPGDCDETVADGTDVVLTATANPGSIFVNWTNCDNPSGNVCTEDVTQDETITANFTLAEFTLLVTTSGLGSGTLTTSPAGFMNCADNCMADFNFDQNVTITLTTTATGIVWTGSCSTCTGTSCMVDMTTDRTCDVALTP